jgi:hypothetical protein
MLPRRPVSGGVRLCFRQEHIERCARTRLLISSLQNKVGLELPPAKKKPAGFGPAGQIKRILMLVRR